MLLVFPEALEIENASLILISFVLLHAAMIVETPRSDSR